MIQTEEIQYIDGETVCHGFMAYNSNNTKPLPCVMIAPDWTGRSEAMCIKARQLANIGYVGFVIDMYGEARQGTSKEQKRALMTPLTQDRKKLAARILAALNAASALPQVDSTRIAAIGYCFGGLCVLDLARTGAKVKGVVSFHGLLSAPPATDSFEEVQAKILVLHGYDDPLVPPEQVHQFAIEMTEKKADWQVHMYGLTAHSFTDPEANDDEMGLHYNEQADHRSWASTELFLKEIL